MEEVTERGLAGREGVAAAASQSGTRGPGAAVGCPAKNKQTDRHIRQSHWVCRRGAPGGAQTLCLGAATSWVGRHPRSWRDLYSRKAEKHRNRRDIPSSLAERCLPGQAGLFYLHPMEQGSSRCWCWRGGTPSPTRPRCLGASRAAHRAQLGPRAQHLTLCCQAIPKQG